MWRRCQQPVHHHDDQEFGDLIDEDGGAATHLFDAQANTNAAGCRGRAGGALQVLCVWECGFVQRERGRLDEPTNEQWTPRHADLPAGWQHQHACWGQKQYYLDQETTFLPAGHRTTEVRGFSTTRFTSDDPIRQAAESTRMKYGGMIRSAAGC